MSSRRSVGSIQERGDKVWLVQVTAGRDHSSGKRRRLSKTVRGPKRAAERVLAQMLLEVGEVDAAMTALSLEQYLTDVWIPSLAHCRRLTVEGYEGKIERFITPYIGHVKLESLTPYMLDRWMGDLTHDKVSGHSRLHAYRVLKSALRQAVKWRLIKADPTAAVDPPKPEPHDPKILSVDQVNELLDAAEGTEVELAVVLAVGGGLRRSEICGLTWNDVDFDAGTISIRRGIHESKGETWEEPPKSRYSRRTITLPAWALDTLRKHRAVGPVVTMSPKKVSNAYRKLRDDAGLPEVPLRDLRHTNATLALSQGVDVVQVSRRLGHSTINTTSTYYLRPLRSADEDAARLIDGIRKRPDSCPKLPNTAD